MDKGYRDVLVALFQDQHHRPTADSVLNELHQQGWRVVPRERDAVPAVGRHRSSDGATARQAAKDVAPRVGTQRHKVLYGLWNVGASTAEELVAVTGVEYRSITPRIGELKRGGLVRETGRTRLGTHGSAQVVIEITAAGNAALGFEPRPAA